ADKLELPIISTSYDTFTVATMINRAIYDQLIKKEIILVEDILTQLEKTYYLKTTDRVKRRLELNKQTTTSHYPVVDETLKVQGIVTSKDVLGIEEEMPIEKIMTKNPMTVSVKTSVASAAHMMVWESIELLPVVDDTGKLKGIISRQDV